MRTPILVLLWVFLASGLFGQSNTVGNMSLFEGLKTEDGRLFYHIYSGGPEKGMPYNYRIDFFGADLQKISEAVIPSNYGGYPAAIVSHMGGLVIYFGMGKEGKVYYFDKTGKEVWNKMFTMEKPRFNEVKLHSLGDSGFLLVRPDKEKKDGFRVERFDKDFSSQWLKTFFPEKGSVDIDHSAAAGGRLAVVTGWKKGAFSSEFEKELYLFDAKSGDIVFNKIIGNTENGFVPDKAILNEAGETFLLGYTYTNAITDGYPKGLAWAAYTPTGEKRYMKEMSYQAEMAKYLKPQSHSIGLYNRGPVPMIYIHNVAKTGTGYRMMGETYQYFIGGDSIYNSIPGAIPSMTTETNAAKPGHLIVMDYVVMDIGQNGEMQKLTRIGKPYKKVQTEGTFLSSIRNAGSYMAPHNYFSYRFAAGEANPVIVGYGWNQNIPYIGVTGMDAKRESPLSRIYLDRSVVEKDKEAGEVSTAYFKSDIGNHHFDMHYTDVLPYHLPGKMLYYNYDAKTNALEMRVLDIPVAAN